MKLWEGRFTQPSAKNADIFNQSLSFDKKLYWHDIFASIAHVKMLGETNILPKEEAEKICDTLQEILQDIESGALAIEGAEDIHTFIEQELVIDRKATDTSGQTMETSPSKTIDQYFSSPRTPDEIAAFWQAIGELRPGLSGIGSVIFRDEEIPPAERSPP